MLESGDVYDADMLYANDKYERECSLIKLWHRKCISFYIGSTKVLNIHDSEPVNDQVHMWIRSTQNKKFVKCKLKWACGELIQKYDGFCCYVVDY